MLDRNKGLSSRCRRPSNTPVARRYTINGAHSYRFIVSANVIPITLDLMEEELDFRFEDTNLDPFIQKQLVIHNPVSCTAAVRAQNTDCAPARWP